MTQRPSWQRPSWQLLTWRWAPLALAVVVAVCALWLKVRLEAGAALDRAREREQAGDVQLAVASYRDTIRWYSPGSGPVAEAVDGLEALAKTADTAGRTDEALMAYRALRSALYGIRSLYRPYDDRLGPVNDRIAALMGKTPDDVARHRELLDRDPAPDRTWSLIAVLGFFAWVGTLFGLASRGFDGATGAFQPGRAAPWLAGFALTSATWMVGLALA